VKVSAAPLPGHERLIRLAGGGAGSVRAPGASALAYTLVTSDVADLPVHMHWTIMHSHSSALARCTRASDNPRGLQSSALPVIWAFIVRGVARPPFHVLRIFVIGRCAAGGQAV
jgi:hypothetical protein